MKIGLRHVLSWPKLGLEPKFHESGTFGGFGKVLPNIQRIFNTGPPPPLKNQNFENRAFKNALLPFQMMATSNMIIKIAKYAVHTILDQR